MISSQILQGLASRTKLLMLYSRKNLQISTRNQLSFWVFFLKAGFMICFYSFLSNYMLGWKIKVCSAYKVTYYKSYEEIDFIVCNMLAETISIVLSLNNTISF